MQWPLRKLSGREKEYPCRDSWSIPSSRTLVHHPEFNRRLLGRSIHGFKEVNVPRPIRHARERRADIVLLRNIDRHSLADIAADLWQQAHDAARGEFQYDPPTRLYRSLPQRLRRHLLRFQVWLNNNWNLPADRGSERQRCAAVLINYPGFDGAAPLRSFKPSRLPAEGFPFSITMGRTEPRPVATVEGILAIRPVAPVFAHADRRLVDLVQVGELVQSLREALGNPQRLDENTPASQELSSVLRSPAGDTSSEAETHRLSGNDRQTLPHQSSRSHQ